MRKIAFSTVLILTLIAAGFAAEDMKLLRTPDINGDLVVFTYAGDIWSVPASGGEARRLTSHLGMELFPKISPDGKWIAFAAEYSGTRQVYVMPSGGGVPRQLTYYNSVGVMPPRGGFDNQIMDWTPDSKKILFRGNRTPWGERMGKYYLVGLDGGMETPLQIPEAGGGTFSPDGQKIAYTPISREFRNWKRYVGGRAPDIWTYDLAKDEAKRTTDFEGTDQHPIWFKDAIYFVSDRNLTLNIFALDPKSGKTEAVTNHTDYDVLWPSGRNGLIAYESGGSIYVLDCAARQTRRIKVAVDFDSPYTLPYFKNVSDTVAASDISPTGKRALFEARGDIFTVPATEGVTYNLTNTQGVRERDPVWSPDGRYIAFYSDKGGEYEVQLLDTQNDNAVTQVTEGSRVWQFPMIWSPDSSKLLFADKNETLQVLDVKTKKTAVVDKARQGDILDYSWSPDSKWITYSKDVDNGQNAVWVYSLDQQKTRQLTDGYYNDFSPVFSRCGKYLFFLSQRTFNLAFSSFEFNYLYNNAGGVYAIVLTEKTPPLLPDKNDVEPVKKEEPKPAEKAAGAKVPEKKGEAKKEPAAEEKKAPEVAIDFAGANERVVGLAIPSGNYGALAAVDGGVIYARNGTLYLFNVSDKKESQILSGVRGGSVSADGKKLLYNYRQGYGIIDIKPNQKEGDGALKLTDMNLRIEPRKEWEQMFNDNWKIYRDWFYVKNLHRVDWEAMKVKYGKLVPYLGHRADLDFIFSELVAELNIGHAYISWGNFPTPDRVEGGLLGAELAADPKSSRFVIKKIYAGENWSEGTRSPLTEQGVDVKEGDYLISLNGHEVTTADNPYKFLENMAGKKIPIEVNGKPDKSGAREYWIRPIESELKLLYMDWVRSRRELVDKLSGGRIGYIHVPDTSIDGNRELYKGMYAFANKDALIIDERYNGGGFIPWVMIELLNRTLLNFTASRGLEMNSTPGTVHVGPKVMLINHYSASGGDAFPYYFKKLGLGPLIGTRTWGGLVGIGGNAALIDGTANSVPRAGFVDTEGNWMVEGLGVAPDIEVWDNPDLVAKGKDPSLEKGVAVLLEMLAKNPPKKVARPADPDRSKWHEKKK